MIQSIYLPDVYEGDDVEDTFEFTFRILAKTDLIAIVKDEDGVVTTLELDTDYTIADGDVNTDDGGDVVLEDPLTDGSTLYLYRFTARTQLINIEEGSPFPAATITKELDRIRMQIQELDEEVGRALKFAMASTFKDVDVPDPEEGTVLGWQDDELANVNLGDKRNEESVSEGAENFDVVFDEPEANANYLVLALTANWATTLEYSDKLITGFTVTFSNPAPAGAKLTWSILSQ